MKKPRKLKKVYVANGPIPKWLLKRWGQFAALPDYLSMVDGQQVTSLTLRPHLGMTVDLGAGALTAAAVPEGETAWTSPGFMFTDTWTNEGRRDGGRMIDPEGFHLYGTSDTLPLMAQVITPAFGGHEGALLAGMIQRESIIQGSGPIPAEGVFADTAYGQEIAAVYQAGYMTGVSVDLAIMGYEIVYITDEETGDILDADFIARDWAIMGATGTPFPAFENARINVGEAAAEPVAEAEAAGEVITAAALVSFDSRPPPEWFPGPEGPGLSEPTPATMTDDGHVYGHFGITSAVAASLGIDACHVGFSDRCICLPEGSLGHNRFVVPGQWVECRDDSRVTVGTITLRGGHPLDSHMSEEERQRHYDDTDSITEAVVVGYDQWGMWAAGCVRPGLSDDDLWAVRASSWSGDWVPYQRTGTYELLRICHVTTPGFPILTASGFPLPTVQTRLAVTGDQVTALTAAGHADYLARLKAGQMDAERPVTRGEMAEMREMVDDLTAAVRPALAVTEALEPDARQRLLDRIG